jgi:hypothetical protein
MAIHVSATKYGPVRTRFDRKTGRVTGFVSEADRQRHGWAVDDAMLRGLLASAEGVWEKFVPRRRRNMTIWDFEQLEPRRRRQTARRQTADARAAALATVRQRAAAKRALVERIYKQDPGLPNVEIARRASARLGVPVSRQVVAKILGLLG